MTEVLIKERPILFSGAMVRALLAGTKTQTRRAIKPQPIIDEDSGYVYDGNGRAYKNDSLHLPWQDGFARDLCPYGQPGERLWVRETLSETSCGSYLYAADGAHVPERAYDHPIFQKEKKAIVSIHMPRVASRLLLEITAVRVERLNDISEADAVAEGIEQTEAWGGSWTWYQDYLSESNQLLARESYQSLWRKINGPESWEANPWVWVVEFKVLKPA